MESTLVEENQALLLGRWEHLRANPDGGTHMDLGMDPETVSTLIGLESKQVRLAADAAAPLFRLALPDDALEKLLRGEEGIGGLRSTEVDTLIRTENQLFLANRWHAAGLSEAHAQAHYYLSSRAVRALRAASFVDVQRAAGRGCPLAFYAGRQRYLFHAGRNFALSRVQRTHFASCCVTRQGN